MAFIAGTLPFGREVLNAGTQTSAACWCHSSGDRSRSRRSSALVARCAASGQTFTRRRFCRDFAFASLSLISVLGSPRCQVASAATAPEAALVQVCRAYDALDELVRLIEQSQDTRSLRQTIRIIVKQSNLKQSIKSAANGRLPAGPIRDAALREGLDALEYLSQVTAYYNPVSKVPTLEMRSFAIESVKAAKQRLQAYLDAFPPDEVERARRTVFVQDVAAYESM
jgi:hypothetical protein